MTDTDTAAKLDAQVALYKSRQGRYTALAEILKSALQGEVERLGFLAIVQARAKSIPSFAEKCVRKQAKYANPADQLTDLCGVRVIVESKDQIPSVYAFIAKHFDVDQDNSGDVAARLSAAEFGYQSVHYVVSLRKGAVFGGAAVPKDLCAWRSEEDARRLGMVRGPIYKAEIQVRTLLQHAWANLAHDNVYKSDFKAPAHMVRIATRTAALLEEADNAFVGFLEAAQFYKTYYGAYMTRNQSRAEIATLTAVLRHDQGNLALAHKIARHALAVEDWKTAAERLGPFEADPAAQEMGALRDLAVARIKLGHPGGLELLQKAADANPADADALCELGDALRDVDTVEAHARYQAAYRLKPSYPRVLRSFILSQMQCGSAAPSFLSFVRPNLEQAVATCRQWAGSNVYLPLAFFDAGLFTLLLGDKPYESLDAYARAIVASETRAPILTACRQIEDVMDAWADCKHELRPALEWTHAFLLAAVVAKIHAEAVEADNAVTRLKRELAQQEKQQASLQPCQGTAEKQHPELQEKIDKLKQALPLAEEKRSTLAAENRDAVGKYLANTGLTEKHRRCLATTAKHGTQPPFERSKPVIIVAGGCDKTVAQRIDAYADLFAKAFEGYTGTLVSGGTTAGISALVGDLPFPSGAVDKVAYLPERLPDGDHIHPAYNPVLRLPEDSYTPMGPVQVWIDLLACGVDPMSVRLVGINGGDLSAFEYRLALAMGAKVGILRDSGREAARLSDDPNWRLPNLLLLPTDQETLRLFVNPPEKASSLRDEDVLTLAKQAHEKYRAERGRSLAPVEPGLCDWDHLLPHIKESNRQQAANIEAKLRRVGLAVRKAEGRAVALYPLDDPTVIDVLAELEHARWNMERLLDGWSPGDRDPVKKTSPYLVPWNELPEDIKQYDRDAVADIPLKLAKLGYEVYRP